MSKRQLPLRFLLVTAVSALYFAAWIRAQAQEVPPAPTPVQITSAKTVFIANAGEENDYLSHRNHWFTGGSHRAYDQFYAAMKSWGRYGLAATPGDADLIFEIEQKDARPVSVPMAYLSLRIIDPKTHVVLWGLSGAVELAGRSQNREKNFNAAMTSLVNDLKNVASPASVAPKN